MRREHLVVARPGLHRPILTGVDRRWRPAPGRPITGTLGGVRIRAIAVFEGVVYNCFAVDLDRPDRPVLEVDALLRPGDADEGPLLVPVPTFMALLGGADAAEPHLRLLSRRGRLVDRQGVRHVAFPLWTDVTDSPDA
jgi:hypothetical protein